MLQFTDLFPNCGFHSCLHFQACRCIKGIPFCRLPYWHPCGNSSLWLRLDHNDIENIDLLADKGLRMLRRDSAHLGLAASIPLHFLPSLHFPPFPISSAWASARFAQDRHWHIFKYGLGPE